MSEFFRAPAVRAAMAEIQELQEDIMTGIAVRGMRNPTTEEGHLYIAKMRQLLEKQKNFMFRLSLEKEDSDALEMKKQLEKSVELMGFPAGTDISVLFNGMNNTIDKLKQVVDP